MSLRNVVLFLMFGGLAYGLYYLYHAQTIKPLQAELIAVDTARINKLRLHPADQQERVIELQREGHYWIASNGQVHLRALEPPVQALLRNLTGITTVDVAAKDESDWLQYGLAPGQAVRIEVYENDELSEDFWVGLSGRELPTAPDSLAYIRIHHEQEVYAVKGLETYPFHQGFSTFRSKNFLSVPEQVLLDSFSFVFPDTNYTFSQREGQWQIAGGAAPDAQVVGRFLQNLQNIHADIFVDDFDDTQTSNLKYGSLILYPPAMGEPILIHAYQDTLREHPFILQSTQNPGCWYGSDSSGIFSRLFWDVEIFLGSR